MKRNSSRGRRYESSAENIPTGSVSRPISSSRSYRSYENIPTGSVSRPISSSRSYRSYGADSGFYSGPDIEEVIFLPLKKRILEPPDHAFFTVDVKVLERIGRSLIQDSALFIYFNATAENRSKLEQALKDAAYAAICSRLPYVKTRQVLSMEELISRIPNENIRKLLKNFLQEILARNMTDEHINKLEGRVAKHFSKLKGRPFTSNASEGRTKIRRSTRKFTLVQKASILGIICDTDATKTGNHAKRLYLESHFATMEKEKNDINGTVYQALIEHPSPFLVDLSPVTLAMVFDHIGTFEQLVSDITSEGQTERIYRSDIISSTLKDYLLQIILPKAKTRYGLQSMGVASYHQSGIKLFIGYDDEATERKRDIFCGVSVEIRNPKIVYATQVSLNKYDGPIAPEIKENIAKCMQDNSDSLWERHSNLNAILTDVYDGGPFDFHIVLVCSGKGIIPLGEDSFPEKLTFMNHGISTRVFEGYFSFGPSFGNPQGYNDPLSMGCTIGAESRDMTGSLGLFITDDDFTGFLTCTHVLFDCLSQTDWSRSPVRVFQPGSHDLHCAYSEDEKCIGKTLQNKVIFTPSSPSLLNQDVSVDATLVLVEKRMPKEGLFAVRDLHQLHKSGFTQDRPPKLSSIHHIEELKPKDHGKMVFKSGGSTGFTRGFINIGTVEVRVEDLCVRYFGNGASSIKIMKGQHRIEDVGDVFFLPGDSGSAVFAKNENEELYCIGIAIGYVDMGTERRSTVFTPIDAILKHLGLSYKNVNTFKQQSKV